MKETVFLFACLVLGVVPVLFVLNKVYEDGVVGRAFLLAIAFFAWTFLIERFNGVRYDVLPQTAGFAVAVAGFLCWHLWRFHRRVLKRRAEGKAWPNWVPH